MSDKNEIIRSAAAQVAENYRKSDILMYGDALRLPSRTAVIEKLMLRYSRTLNIFISL